jgi:hypothetical protein
MTQITYAVPLEAVSHGADFAGKIVLTKLAAERAELHQAAVVELGPQGWLATVLYTTPGRPARQQVAHVALLWAPQVHPLHEDQTHGV